MSLLILSLFLSLSGIQASGQDKYPRNTAADILHYDFTIALNDSTDEIRANASIIVRFIKESDSISFDLTNRASDKTGMSVNNVTVDSLPVKWSQKGDHIKVIFNSSAPVNDTLRISMGYSGIPSDGLIISNNKFGRRVFFSDHWPDRAHNYLPCIDHPYDKASVDFIITAPVHYNVVSNGVITEEKTTGKYKTTHWSESAPISTKVMAFAAAEFAIDEAGSVDNVPVSSWVFPENSDEGFRDYKAALGPLRFYIGLLGKYPFEKLANIQSKTIYGGMENAGAIFYAENSVTGRGLAELLMAHEIAHQWFGNTVTEDDWFHVWLSEGFATYLTNMYIESAYGEERFRAQMASDRKEIIDFHEENKKPVVDTTVTDLMNLLNVNSYQKGAWALHMLRNEVGDESFIRGLRLYYERYYQSNALTMDFQEVMEEVSGKDLNKFFRQWLWTEGFPVLKIHDEKVNRSTREIIIEQTQEPVFEFNIELQVQTPSGSQKITVPVKDRITRFEVKSKENLIITPDPEVKLLFN
ncbi:MAG TPA: M1 family metallopeptidase [Bacteroidales bacterium]|nr:M1 family metallopeptidase [Bacteroidales bacterium]